MRLGIIKKYSIIAFSLSMVACASQPSMYQWGSYQAQTYEYLKGGGKSPEEQIAILEKDLQQIAAHNGAAPPGLHAHLGLLYIQTGNSDALARELQTEKQLFPESTAYMDFLMRNFSKKDR